MAQFSVQIGYFNSRSDYCFVHDFIVISCSWQQKCCCRAEFEPQLTHIDFFITTFLYYFLYTWLLPSISIRGFIIEIVFNQLILTVFLIFKFNYAYFVLSVCAFLLSIFRPEEWMRVNVKQTLIQGLAPIFSKLDAFFSRFCCSPRSLSHSLHTCFVQFIF